MQALFAGLLLVCCVPRPGAHGNEGVYERLRDWLVENGATGMDRLQITDFPHCTHKGRCSMLRGIALAGDQDLRPSQSIVSVPKSVLMCDYHALQPPLSMAARLGSVNVTLPTGESARDLLYST